MKTISTEEAKRKLIAANPNSQYNFEINVDQPMVAVNEKGTHRRYLISKETYDILSNNGLYGIGSVKDIIHHIELI
jgi:PHD/YefM family antitoxin component YafN of YafNO toxin-antitoxin module